MRNLSTDGRSENSGTFRSLISANKAHPGKYYFHFRFNFPTKLFNQFPHDSRVNLSTSPALPDLISHAPDTRLTQYVNVPMANPRDGFVAQASHTTTQISGLALKRIRMGREIKTFIVRQRLARAYLRSGRTSWCENGENYPRISIPHLPTSPVTFLGVWASKYGSLIIVACVRLVSSPKIS